MESASHCVETGSYGQEQEIPTATLDGGEGADVMPGLYELNGSRFLYKTNGLLKNGSIRDYRGKKLRYKKSLLDIHVVKTHKRPTA